MHTHTHTHRQTLNTFFVSVITRYEKSWQSVAYDYCWCLYPRRDLCPLEKWLGGGQWALWEMVRDNTAAVKKHFCFWVQRSLLPGFHGSRSRSRCPRLCPDADQWTQTLHTRTRTRTHTLHLIVWHTALFDLRYFVCSGSEQDKGTQPAVKVRS